MLNRFGPALLTALVCLAVGAGGAVAAKPVTKLITGKSVKDNSLTSADIRNGSLSADDLKAGTLKTNEHYWARIVFMPTGPGDDLQPTVERSGGGKFSVSRVEKGLYSVEVDRDVSHCGLSVTPLLQGDGYFYDGPGAIPQGRMLFAAAWSRSIRVQIFNDAGKAAMSDFNVVVFCP